METCKQSNRNPTHIVMKNNSGSFRHLTVFRSLDPKSQIFVVAVGPFGCPMPPRMLDFIGALWAPKVHDLLLKLRWLMSAHRLLTSPTQHPRRDAMSIRIFPVPTPASVDCTVSPGPALMPELSELERGACRESVIFRWVRTATRSWMSEANPLSDTCPR